MVSTKDVQKSAVVTKTMQARNSKVNKELVGYESRMTNLMEKVVTQCIKDLQKTGDEDLKKFAQFYSANYIDSNCAGGKVSIYCSTQETQKLSDELKDNFAIARAYRFLACSNDTSKNNPALQKCKDFKI